MIRTHYVQLLNDVQAYIFRYLTDTSMSCFKFYFTASGHYLYLLETSNRPSYSARVQTPFMKTAGICLQLFYYMVGKSHADDPGTIAIYARMESLDGSWVVIQAKDSWAHMEFPLVWHHLHVHVYTSGADRGQQEQIP